MADNCGKCEDEYESKRKPSPPDGKAYATCKDCGSTVRLFAQCSPCLLRFIKATDVAAKSSYYKPEHLYQQRSY